MTTNRRTRRKIAYMLKIVSVIVVWEFAFPGHAVAYEQPAVIAPAETKSAEVTHTNRLPHSPDKPREVARRVTRITITAYSSTRDQTDSDPFTTASGTKVRDGVIAANFLPIGTRVRIPEYFGDKVFVVEDRMSARHWNMADIWMSSRNQAKQWGARYTKLEIL